MDFDTRDTKPKLYNVLVLTFVVALVIGLLVMGGAQKHAVIISLTLLMYYIAVLVMLVNALIGQIRYNPYSYNTIYYTGFGIIMVDIIITHALRSVSLICDEDSESVKDFLHILLESARNFMNISFPFLLVFAGGLCISNIVLLMHESRSFKNILGILLSFMLIAGQLFIIKTKGWESGDTSAMLIRTVAIYLFAAIYIYFESMLIGIIAADIIAATYEPEYNKDYMIILGCGLRRDGSPTPLLAGRIDRAMEFARKQSENGGKELIFITSGGQGSDEVISESSSMKRYLIEHGISEDRIIEEDRSTDTLENMRFSKAKILEAQGEKGLDACKIAFSTTNYHVFRSGTYARLVKMRAVGIGAPTKWYFWPNASVREFVSLLTEHRSKQLAILGGILLFYSLLTLKIYL